MRPGQILRRARREESDFQLQSTIKLSFKPIKIKQTHQIADPVPGHCGLLQDVM